MPYNWDAPFEIRDIRNGEWYWVQKEILASKKINASDKLVYSALAYYANNETQNCYPSYTKICELTGLCRNTAIKGIKALIKSGFISKKHTDKKTGGVNYYELLRIGGAKIAPVNKVVQKRTLTSPKENLGVVQKRTSNNTYINKTYLTRLNNISLAKVSSLKEVKEADLIKIAELYQVPLAFVKSKYDDLINYCEATGKRYKNYVASLRNFVKKDALKIRKEELYGKPEKRGIDASNL